MTRENQLKQLQVQRKLIIEELESCYSNAFERISQVGLAERDVARLTQLILQSREAAITTLEKEIESPLITHAPNHS